MWQMLMRDMSGHRDDGLRWPRDFFDLQSYFPRFIKPMLIVTRIEIEYK